MAVEPTTGVAAVIAAVSATLLAVLGVDYYALLWASIASAAALLYAARTTRARAAFVAVSSSLLGAAIGTALAEHLGGARSVLMLSSILCATGARPLIVAGVNAIVTQVNKRAGNPSTPEEPPTS